jgi:hypothetical protein
MHAVRDRADVPPSVVEDLPRTARAAGFEVVNANGWFAVIEPRAGFEFYAASLAAVKERAVQVGVATAQAIDEQIDALRAATNGDFQWVASVSCLGLTLRAPTG